MHGWRAGGRWRTGGRRAGGGSAAAWVGGWGRLRALARAGGGCGTAAGAPPSPALPAHHIFVGAAVVLVGGGLLEVGHKGISEGGAGGGERGRQRQQQQRCRLRRGWVARGREREGPRVGGSLHCGASISSGVCPERPPPGRGHITCMRAGRAGGRGSGAAQRRRPAAEAATPAGRPGDLLSRQLRLRCVPCAPWRAP